LIEWLCSIHYEESLVASDHQSNEWGGQNLREKTKEKKKNEVCIDCFSGAIHPSRRQHTTIHCTSLSKCACSPSSLPRQFFVKKTPMRRERKTLNDDYFKIKPE